MNSIMRVGPIALLFLLALLPMWPGLSDIFILKKGPDDLANGIASLIFLSHVLEDHLLPVWNNVNFVGNPLGGDPMWGAWHPINLLFAEIISLISRDHDSIVDNVYAYFNIYRYSLSLITSIGAYFLFRELTHKTIPAIIGACIPIFDIQIQFYNLTTLAFLPLASLWAVRSVNIKRDYLSPAIFGVIVGIMILGGQIKMFAYCLLVILCFVVYSWNRENRPLSLQLLYKALLAAIIFFFVASPLLYGVNTYVEAGAWRWVTDGLSGAAKNIPAEAALLPRDAAFGGIASLSKLSTAIFNRITYLSIFLIYLSCIRKDFKLSSVLFVFTIAMIFISLGDTLIQNLLFSYVPGWAKFRVHKQILFPCSTLFGAIVARGAAELDQEELYPTNFTAALAVLTFLLFSLSPHPLSHVNDIAAILAASWIAVSLFTRNRSSLTHANIPRRGTILASLSLLLLIFIKVISVPGQFKNPANYYNEPPAEFENSRAVARWLNSIKLANDPFRIDTRLVPFTTWYFSFFYDIESLGGYGGLALRTTAKSTWERSLAENNVRFILARGDKPPRNDIPLTNVYTSGELRVWELATSGQRIRLECPPGETGPRDVQIDNYSRTKIVATTTGLNCFVMHATAYFPKWKASIDGKEAVIQNLGGQQAVKLTDNKRHVVTMYYDDKMEMSLFGLSFGTLFFCCVLQLTRLIRRID